MAHDAKHCTVHREVTSPELYARYRELETMVRVFRNALDKIAMRACA